MFLLIHKHLCMNSVHHIKASSLMRNDFDLPENEVQKIINRPPRMALKVCLHSIIV